MFFDVSSLYTFKLESTTSKQEGRFNPRNRQQALNDVQVLEKTNYLLVELPC